MENVRSTFSRRDLFAVSGLAAGALAAASVNGEANRRAAAVKADKAKADADAVRARWQTEERRLEGRLQLAAGQTEELETFAIGYFDDARLGLEAWADAVAGIVVTGFICHVGWEVTGDIAHRLLDGVDPEIITTAETAAIEVPGVQHAHARARWTGRTLRVEVEGFLDSETSLTTSDQIGRSVASLLTSRIPEMQSFTWSARAS